MGIKLRLAFLMPPDVVTFAGPHAIRSVLAPRRIRANGAPVGPRRNIVDVQGDHEASAVVAAPSRLGFGRTPTDAEVPAHLPWLEKTVVGRALKRAHRTKGVVHPLRAEAVRVRKGRIADDV